MLSDHNEENDGCSEDIDSLALVWLVQVDLWSHVIHGSKLCSQVSITISAIDWSSKSKVRNFDAVKLIKE